MTVQPPPPPPPPANVGIPAWAMYAGAAAIAAVVAVFGFGLLGGDDDGAAAAGGTGPLVTFADGSSSTVAPSTTDGSSTSTPGDAGTSTTSTSTTTSSTTTTSTSTTSTTTTTTTIPFLLDEDFEDGQTASFPLFAGEYMDWVVGGGDLTLGAWYSGILPAMYPAPFPDAVFEMLFVAEPDNPNAEFGMIVLAEDPSDFVVEEYLLVYVNPDANTVGAFAFRNGGFGQAQFVTIPPAAGWAPFAEGTLRAVVSGASVDIFINGVYALTWTGDLNPAPGWFGPVVVGGEDGDGDGFLAFPDLMRIGYVRVEALAG